MSVHKPGGPAPAAALLSLVALTLPLAASAQAPATAQWSTYLGGSAADRISAVTQLSDGEVVIVGTTASQSLVPNPPSSGPRSTGADILVAHFDSDGSTIPEFPFLIFGGSGADEAAAATLGPNNELYLVGTTTSPTASITGAGTVLRSSSIGTDAFLARISPTGTPDWFLFLSGNGDDVATGVTVIGGNVYVSGWTTSTDFTGSTGRTPAGMNGFVVRVEPTATTATIGWIGGPLLIGGAGTDTLRGITSGLGTELLAVGTTNSAILDGNPLVVLNSYHGGSSDAFVVSLDPGTGSLEWLAFVGGSGSDEGNAIAMRPGEGQSFAVVGTTDSTNLGGGLPPAGKNAFVAWLNTTGLQRLIQVRGGAADDEALTVTTDSYGTAYVGGRTASADFPGAANGFDSTIESGTGLREGFVWMAPPEGGDGWASFVGGVGTDEVKTLSLRASNRLVLGLDTDSGSGLPGTFTYDSSFSSPPDGYILSVSVNDLIPPLAGEVFDRLQLDDVHEDVDETLSTTSIFANWTAFTENQTGIAKYEWAIGTVLNPTSVQPFISVGTQQSATATGLSLVVGERYIITVRAQNSHGLTAIAKSNGVAVTNPMPPDGGTDGGTGGTDGGTGGADGGTSGTDGGTDGGMDGGTNSPDAGSGGGEEPGEEPSKGPKSPAGWQWGCASTGGAGLPLLLGLIALLVRGRGALPWKETRTRPRTR